MKIYQLKALQDNYIFALQSPGTAQLIVIDPSEAQPVIDFCQQNDFTVSHIINTHHHYDHVGGNLELQKKYVAEILCYKADKNRTPGANTLLSDNENIKIHSWQMQILHIPGHTLGQIAIHCESQKCVFVGDTLFRFGCGRLFEGDAQMMFDSLKKLKNLPADTKIYCGHEYAENNLNFLELHKFTTDQNIQEMRKQIEAELSEFKSAVPFSISEQLNWNPFLKAKNSSELKKWRDLRDQF